MFLGTSMDTSGKGETMTVGKQGKSLIKSFCNVSSLNSNMLLCASVGGACCILVVIKFPNESFDFRLVPMRENCPCSRFGEI